MMIIATCSLKKKKSRSLNLIIKMSPLSQFCLGSISEKSDFMESTEVYFKENIYYFSIDNVPIDKSNILNVPKYLMGKNNVK